MRWTGSIARRHAVRWLTALAAAAFGAVAAQAGPLKTPLEAAGFATLPDNSGVARYLRDLAAASREARQAVIGRSAGGRPIAAVFLSNDLGFPGTSAAARGKLSVLLVGAQHGTEPSGGEALQQIARDIALGRLHGLLEEMNLIIVPVSNPDGRDRHRRVNEAGINLSTDFLVQTQPETRALTELIRDARPQIVLDIHESAIYKPSTLGKQGYMPELEAQLEAATNPNVAPALRRLGHERLIPAVIRQLVADGLSARRYIGEITDIDQPITYGGLTLRNVRNYAGMRGLIAVLLENRLDPPGNYPTPRNIAVRVAKQYRSVRTFLGVVAEHRADIIRTLARAAARGRESRRLRRVALVADYVADGRTPTITLPMLRLKSASRRNVVVDRQVDRTFAYHPRVRETLAVPLPRGYAITAFQADIGNLLRHHGIAFTVLGAPRTERAEIQHVVFARRSAVPYGKKGTMLEIRTRQAVREVRLEPGDLWIDLDQPLGSLVPLMLDPRSSTSIYQDPAFHSHLRSGQDHYAFGIP